MAHRTWFSSAPSIVFPTLVASLVGCGATHASEPPPAAPLATEKASTTIRRTLVRRQPAHEPGYETRLYLVEYPPLAKANPHVHPAVGIGWVVEGSFESAFGDEPITTVHEGEGFVDPADIPHRFFRNPSPDHALRFVIAYTTRVEDEQFRPLP